MEAHLCFDDGLGESRSRVFECRQRAVDGVGQGRLRVRQRRLRIDEVHLGSVVGHRLLCLKEKFHYSKCQNYLKRKSKIKIFNFFSN